MKTLIALWLSVLLTVAVSAANLAPAPTKTTEERQASEIVNLKAALVTVCKQRDDAKATLQACMRKAAHKTVVNARKNAASNP